MTTAPETFIGQTLDNKYRLEERLGKGGMGEVYRATHLRLEQSVAVKMMNPQLLNKPEARRRFLREARATGLVQHPNTVSVTDFGETADGLVYLVMEFLEGQSLRQIISAEAPLDPARAVSLMLQVAAAVGAAHEAGVIHRDLKPPNIFLEQRKDARSSVRLLDFGIAKLLRDAETDEDSLHYITGGGTILGTPRYMSPEQCDGETLTAASDVYSLGVILYELLTGETPFSGNAVELILQHSYEWPRPLREINPHIPESLEKLTLHALAKNPFNRPANASIFRVELFATAERLGLEHPHADLVPALEKLQDEGYRSPSGRYVIDLEKLREERAFGVRLAEAVPQDDRAVEGNNQAGTEGGQSRVMEGLATYSAPSSVLRTKGLLFVGLALCLLSLSVGAVAWFRPVNFPNAGDTKDAVTTPARPIIRGGEPAVATTPIVLQPETTISAPETEPAAFPDTKPNLTVEPEVERSKPKAPRSGPTKRRPQNRNVNRTPLAADQTTENVSPANPTTTVVINQDLTGAVAGNPASTPGPSGKSSRKQRTEAVKINDTTQPAATINPEGATRARRVRRP